MRCALPLVRAWGCLCLLALAAGCAEDDPGPPAAAEAPPSNLAARFDSSTAGTITGLVLWQGERPRVAPLEVVASLPFGPPLDRDHAEANPNAPAIDPATGGVADAVVFLRDVHPERARPWDLGPVRIEQRGAHIHVLQDTADSRVGFVRRGDAATLVSADPFYHALRGSGASFFTLAFPDPGSPLQRRFPQKGYVELTSGAGYYWMRGHIFVDDHPYYARTDARGRFVLREVPPGRYRLACWHPSWLAAGHDRDPESALITRLTFRPPVVLEQAVKVPPGGAASAHFRLTAEGDKVTR